MCEALRRRGHHQPRDPPDRPQRHRGHQRAGPPLRRPGASLGAGTVLDARSAQACIDAGRPLHREPGAGRSRRWPSAARRGVAVFPGALTPTEIITAWKAGADMVKVFPASAVGGAAYIKNIKAPLPQIELVPTGGVSIDTAASFIQAGAAALGVGGDLVDLQALREGRDRGHRRTGRPLPRGAARRPGRPERASAGRRGALAEGDGRQAVGEREHREQPRCPDEVRAAHAHQLVGQAAHGRTQHPGQRGHRLDHAEGEPLGLGAGLPRGVAGQARVVEAAAARRSGRRPERAASAPPRG